jgi:hypothetical protein
MSTRRQRSTPRAAATAPGVRKGEATTTPATRVVPERRPLVVLGAGADVDYGMPLVQTLLPDLARWTREDGQVVSRALKAQLKNMVFSFDKLTADRSGSPLAGLFSGDRDQIEPLELAANRLRRAGGFEQAVELLDKLCGMAGHNVLPRPTINALGQALDVKDDMGDAEPLLDPRSLSLSEMPKAYIRTTFVKVLIDGPKFPPGERAALELFISSVSNIEQLLSQFFTLFCAGEGARRKTYLYVVWMLWAYLKSKSTGLAPRRSIYANLPEIGGEVITFNYTNFFDQRVRSPLHFHGNLEEVLQVEDRVLRKPSGIGVATPDHLAHVLAGLRLDVSDYPNVDLPGIVPPTSFKPVMSRRQLQTWAKADDLVQAAKTILIVGYSFATADEHFNDLLRSSSARVLVVDPNMAVVPQRVCQVLNVDRGQLTERRVGEWDVLASRQVTCVGAKAADVTVTLVKAALR